MKNLFMNFGVTGVLMLLVAGCTPAILWDPAGAWNGYYSDRAAVRDFDKKSNEYYSKENPEQQAKRIENDLKCAAAVRAKYPNIQLVRSEGLYSYCMDKYGTHVFGWGVFTSPVSQFDDFLKLEDEYYAKEASEQQAIRNKNGF